MQSSGHVLIIVVTQTEELLDMLDGYVRTGYFWMASSLAGSARIEPALIMCPRYSTDYCRKAHFFSLAQRYLSQRC